MSLPSCVQSDAAPSENVAASLSTGQGLSGQYFTGTGFQTLQLTRTDATVNFDWGAGSPASVIPVDQFSVRWSGKVEALYSELYTFYTQSDDGVRLYVNGQLLINNWAAHASTENSGTITLVAGQRYDIVMEYYEGGGGAIAKLSWSSPRTPKQIVPQSQLYLPVAVGSGVGLKADYFSGVNFDTAVLTRTDGTVNFDWASGSPAASVPVDRFSARWTGQVQPLYSETYTFTTQSDDGIRLWVNGQQLINNWTDHGTTENSGTITLVAGRRYDLRLEYYEAGGGAVAKLFWSSPSQARQIVPSSQLYPTVVSNPDAGVADSRTVSDTRPADSGTVTGKCGTTSALRLAGNQILDTSGTPIVARGPELIAATSSPDAMDAIAKTGANAARLLLCLDAVNGMTPTSIDAWLARAVSHNMIIWLSLYSWDNANNHVIGSSLGGGNLFSLTAPSGTGTCSSSTPAPCFLAMWSRQWLKDLVKKYQGHVIIDAAQEFIGVSDASSEAGRTEWANSAINSVRFFRSAGYVAPLEVMSNFQGRDLYAIIEKGPSIRAADTLVVNGYPQTMFGWQAYWTGTWYKTWQGSLLLGSGQSITGAQAIHQFVATRNYPIQVGLDNIAGDTDSDYRPDMDQAAADKVSWLWWSWQNGAPQAPLDGATCQNYVLNSVNGFAGAVRSACGL